MINQKLKTLAALKARAAALEAEVARARTAELKALPQRYGFDTAVAFIEAVIAASGGRGKLRGHPAKAAGSASGKRRPRAKITDETRDQVKSLVKAGKTGGEIATALGISLPSVQNIKKALGLVKGRK